VELIQSYTIAHGGRKRVDSREKVCKRVQANGRHTGPGGRESASEDNVVRLPREWLGPREELVPIAVDAEPVDALATPPSTHDFWGEALSDGLAATTEEASPEPPRRPRRQRDPHRRLGFGVTHARATLVRRFSGRLRPRTRSVALPARAGSPGADAPRLLRPSAGLAGAIVLMLVGLAISAGGQAGHPARSTRAARPAAPGTTAAVAGIGLAPSATPARLHSRPFGLRTHRSPRRVATTHRAIGRTHRRGAHHATPHTRTNTVEQVRYTAPAATTSAPSSSAPPATTPVPPPATTPAAPPATAAAGTSAGSRQPATGASGALGPGSSPDG